MITIRKKRGVVIIAGRPERAKNASRATITQDGRVSVHRSHGTEWSKERVGMLTNA